MAQFGPVAPLPILMKLADAGEDILGQYHLLLAHDVVKHPKEYNRLFNKKGMFIIMDNSLIELGYPVDGHIMRDACQIVNAQVAVLPDRLSETMDTIALTGHAYGEWSRLGIQHFLVVLQGKDLQALRMCMKAFESLDPYGEHIKMWSVPKIVQKHLNTRYTAIDMLKKANHNDVHLLGFSDNLNDDIYCCRQFPDVVMGIDSAVPIRMGTHQVLLDRDFPAHSPRGDWMQTATNINSEVLTNLRRIREWIKT